MAKSGRKGRVALSYGIGTVSIQQGSTVLRGVDTAWRMLSPAGLPATPHKGWVRIAGGDEAYEVHLVNADGLITLKRPFERENVTDASYNYIEGHAPFEDLVTIDAEQTPKSAPMTPAKNETRSAPSGWGETIRTIVYALLIAFVIRAFLFQPFNIPSGSMIPTLLVGDYIFVSKYAYGFSRHSIPFSPPIFSGRIFGSMPKRGDVVVFKLPSDGHTDYIKRVIGLPGDRIQVSDGVLYINGKPVPRKQVSDFILRDSLGNITRMPRYRETLPNGVSYYTLDTEPDGSYDNTDEYVVPAGHFFVMGDNRDNSLDSRAAPNYQYPRSGGVGYVPIENLVGKAKIVFFSTDGTAQLWQVWRWPQATRFGRLCEGIQAPGKTP